MPINDNMPKWRNGRRSGLKIHRGSPLVRVRVSPSAFIQKRFLIGIFFILTYILARHRTGIFLLQSEKYRVQSTGRHPASYGSCCSLTMQASLAFGTNKRTLDFSRVLLLVIINFSKENKTGLGGARTHDQKIKSLLRYQLRYKPIYGLILLWICSVVGLTIFVFFA